MCPTLLSLLSLGFCVSLKIWALAGEYEKLSLSAWPSPVVPLGQTVTLWCHSRSPLKRFTLFKTDERRRLPELQGHYVNNFTLGPVTREHAGFYMCSRASWSAPSDPLQIVVSCVHKTLHLSPPRAHRAAGKECDPLLSLTGGV
uniref:KIR3DXL6 n=1 Tax=Bos taurus TaxID=9913 RepID=A0A075CE13_BOVIN|nr:KIR3DXL6 [Bos taurus]